MSRPRKYRRVCGLPATNLFGPVEGCCTQSANHIVMSVEEFEAIRLIDLQGLMQEECATQMKVARTTVQRIYNEARRKIAQSLVEGQMLRVEGGNFQVCENVPVHLRCKWCKRDLDHI